MSLVCMPVDHMSSALRFKLHSALLVTLCLTAVGCKEGGNARSPKPSEARSVTARSEETRPRVPLEISQKPEIITIQRAPSSPKPPQALEPQLIQSAAIIPSDSSLSRLALRAQGAKWSEAHSKRVGPIPDYAPIRAVYFHRQLAGLAPESALGLEVLLSGLYEVDDYDPGEQQGDVIIEDTMLLWMRDYHPIYVRKPAGELQAIHYLAHNPNRAHYLSRGAPQVDELAHLPIIHENGNLIVAGQWVFVSERLLEDNQDGESEDHLIEGGYLLRSRSELIALLSDQLHIAGERVVILPNMPHEATGHVDLYLMAINDQQVIIPKIVMPLDHFSEHPIELQIAKDVKDFLDERAQQLARLGLDVIRLPQLPPLWLPALDEPEGNFDVVFYTPTNGLLINKGPEQLALLPHFDAEKVRPTLRDINMAYERYWREAFTAFGWPAYMVESTQLGRYLGLLHCVTATTPKLPLQAEWRQLNQLPALDGLKRPRWSGSARVSASRATLPPTRRSFVVTSTPAPLSPEAQPLPPLPNERPHASPTASPR